MRVERLETLHADGGWRTFDFVTLTTDGGLVGWSEYNESFGTSWSRGRRASTPATSCSHRVPDGAPR